MCVDLCICLYSSCVHRSDTLTHRHTQHNTHRDGQRILLRELRYIHTHTGLCLDAADHSQHRHAQLCHIQHKRRRQTLPRHGALPVPGHGDCRGQGPGGRGRRKRSMRCMCAAGRRRALPDRRRGRLPLHPQPHPQHLCRRPCRAVVTHRDRLAALPHARRVLRRGVRGGGRRRPRRRPRCRLQHNSVGCRRRGRRHMEHRHHLPLPPPPQRVLQLELCRQETAADFRLDTFPHPALCKHPHLGGCRQLQPLAFVPLSISAATATQLIELYLHTTHIHSLLLLGFSTIYSLGRRRVFSFLVWHRTPGGLLFRFTSYRVVWYQTLGFRLFFVFFFFNFNYFSSCVLTCYLSDL